jgi:hypothetical protein
MKSKPSEIEHPIVDSHAHLGAWGRFRIPYAEDEIMIQTLDRCGIAAACVSHNLALGVDWRAGNERTLAALDRNPGRVAGYFVVSPHAPAAQIESELNRFLSHPGMCGLKFHTDLHAYPFSGPGYQPALEYAHSHRLPILTHGWEGPQSLERVASRHSGARIILAHAGAVWNGRDENPNLSVAKEMPNVWVDICGSVAYFGALPRLVDLLGPEKILWGTDCTWLDPGPSLTRVLAAGLSHEETSMILGKNAVAVLGLAAWLERRASQ